MKVAFVASDSQGGGRVRSFWPAGALKEKGIDVTQVGIAYPEPGSVDVMVVHRPLEADRLEKIAAHQALGVKVVIDEDDDLKAARILPLFKRNGGFKELVKNHDDCIRQADALVVATTRLKHVYRSLNPNVWVCPNRLPAWIGEFARENANAIPVVGWPGVVDTHRHDLEWLAPVAERALEGARFSTIGDPQTIEVLGIRGAGWQVLPFAYDAHALYQAMSTHDIGIVPLARNELNLAKSHLKALEYMTLGKPVIARSLPEQQALITHGHDGFLADTPERFASFVQVLVRNKELRHEMGKNARQTAKALELEENVQPWLELLEGIGLLA